MKNEKRETRNEKQKTRNEEHHSCSIAWQGLEVEVRVAVQVVLKLFSTFGKQK
jgi:hypothetical protein